MRKWPVRSLSGAGLTLVQGRRHAALHPRRVIVHDVDGDVGVPVGDHLHGPVVLGPLREDRGWGASEAAARFLWRTPMTIATAKEQPPQRPLATGQPLDPTALAVPSHPLEQNTQVCPPGWDGMPGCGVQSPYSGTTLPPGTTLWRGNLLGPPEVHIPGLTGTVLFRATASASTSSVPGQPWARHLGMHPDPAISWL